MDYSAEQLRAAELEDEVRRLRYKSGRIGSGQPSKPQDDDTVVMSGGPVSVDRGTIDDAVAELAADRGEPSADTWREVLTLTGGAEDMGSLTAAVVELHRMPRDATMALTALARMGRDAVTAGAIGLAVRELARQRHEPYADTYAAVREQAAGERDMSSLRAAVLGLATGGPVAGPLAGSPGGPVALTGPGLSDRTRFVLSALGSLAEGPAGDDMLELSRSAPATDVTWYGSTGAKRIPSPADDIVEGILNRHPDLFESQDRAPRRGQVAVTAPGPEDPVVHPVGTVGSSSRAHSTQTDPSDRANPRRGGRKYPNVGVPPGEGGPDAVIARNPELFTSNEPRGANVRHPAKSVAQRNREQDRNTTRPENAISR